MNEEAAAMLKQIILHPRTWVAVYFAGCALGVLGGLCGWIN